MLDARCLVIIADPVSLTIVCVAIADASSDKVLNLATTAMITITVIVNVVTIAVS